MPVSADGHPARPRWRRSNRLEACRPRQARCLSSKFGISLCPPNVVSKMGNTFGQLFRVTTWGESHGGGVGAVIDGCPPRIELSEADIQRDLDRRRPVKAQSFRSVKKKIAARFSRGFFEGRTLGTPISVLVMNKDARPEDYAQMQSTFRPSHADFTYEAKYGIRNWQGGGRASARETIGRVAAGAIAKKVLRTFYSDFEVVAYVTKIHEIAATIDRASVKSEDVERNAVRCPDERRRRQ